MPNGNGTSKWIIALSITIILAVSGWAIAGVNVSRANNIEKNTVKIEINTTEISVLKTQSEIIITKLGYIEQAIDDLKELVKK